MNNKKEKCPKCGKKSLNVSDGDHIEIVSNCPLCGYYYVSA